MARRPKLRRWKKKPKQPRPEASGLTPGSSLTLGTRRELADALQSCWDEEPKKPQKVEVRERGWQGNREDWNREGLCARKVCDQGHADRVHPTTRLRYCDDCADAIEAACADVGLKLPYGPVTAMMKDVKLEPGDSEQFRGRLRRAVEEEQER